MQSIATVVRSIASVLAGYAVMVLGLFVAQDALFGGVSLTATPKPELAIAGALSVLCAVAGGGAVACSLAPKRPVIHACVISLLVGVETVIFAVSGGVGTGDPIWFDLLAGASLMAGAPAGAYAVLWMRQRATSAPPALS